MKKSSSGASLYLHENKIYPEPKYFAQRNETRKIFALSLSRVSMDRLK
jgi:hypothetical protein